MMECSLVGLTLAPIEHEHHAICGSVERELFENASRDVAIQSLLLRGYGGSHVLFVEDDRIQGEVQIAHLPIKILFHLQRGVGPLDLEGSNFPLLPPANFISDRPLYGFFYASSSVLCCRQQQGDHKMLTSTRLRKLTPEAP